MIHYNLRCAGGHGFDGWFRSSAAFDQQSASGLIYCPVCSSTHVQRAMMAPRIASGARASQPEQAAEAPKPPSPPSPPTEIAATPPPPMPDRMRAVLQRMRAEIEKSCDYVGPDFATQARAMHEGAVPHRPIYGETTQDEAESLSDDGIDVARIPWLPRADS